MGSLIALVVGFLALLTALGLIPGERFLFWYIVGLAAAILLGGGWPSWAHLPTHKSG